MWDVISKPVQAKVLRRLRVLRPHMTKSIAKNNGRRLQKVVNVTSKDDSYADL